MCVKLYVYATSDVPIPVVRHFGIRSHQDIGTGNLLFTPIIFIIMLIDSCFYMNEQFESSNQSYSDCTQKKTKFWQTVENVTSDL